MGINKGENAGAMYLSVANGKLVLKHKEPKEGVTTSRVNKVGNTVHEEMFKDVTGVISDIRKKESTQYGDQMEIVVRDGNEQFILQMQFSSRYAGSFLKALPNISQHSEVRIMPWQMDDKNKPGKQVSGITVYEDGVKVLPAFTKEEPNGLPEMTKTKVKGVFVWDDSDMIEFLWAKAQEWVMILKTTKTISSPVTDDEAADEEPPF